MSLSRKKQLPMELYNYLLILGTVKVYIYYCTMYFKYPFKYPAINMQDNISIKYLQNKICMHKGNMLNIITYIVPYNCGVFINCNAMSSGMQQF